MSPQMIKMYLCFFQHQEAAEYWGNRLVLIKSLTLINCVILGKLSHLSGKKKTKPVNLQSQYKLTRWRRTDIYTALYTVQRIFLITSLWSSQDPCDFPLTTENETKAQKIVTCPGSVSESFSKHLLSTHYVLGSVLSGGDKKKEKKSPCSQGAHCLMGKMTCRQLQINKKYTR